MKNRSSCFMLFAMLSWLLFSCGLNADQEKHLNYQTGLYLSALKARSVLTSVSLTHPEYVKYAHSRGDEYFKSSFSFQESETDPMFIDLELIQTASSGNQIHVLYSVRKEYIYSGENTSKDFRFVAISQDQGKTWFFLREGIYRNRKICTKIDRILTI